MLYYKVKAFVSENGCYVWLPYANRDHNLQTKPADFQLLKDWENKAMNRFAFDVYKGTCILFLEWESRGNVQEDVDNWFGFFVS